MESNPWRERHPSAEQVMAEVHPSAETVQSELDEIRWEKEMAEYWDARYHLHIPGAPLTDWDKVTRRRYVQQFTRKQMELGERILRGLQDSEIGND